MWVVGLAITSRRRGATQVEGALVVAGLVDVDHRADRER